MGGRAANVPAAVAGEGIMRKPHLPKAHQCALLHTSAFSELFLHFLMTCGRNTRYNGWTMVQSPSLVSTCVWVE